MLTSLTLIYNLKSQSFSITWQSMFQLNQSFNLLCLFSSSSSPQTSSSFSPSLFKPDKPASNFEKIKTVKEDYIFSYHSSSTAFLSKIQSTSALNSIPSTQLDFRLDVFFLSVVFLVFLSSLNYFYHDIYIVWGFPGSSAGKEFTCKQILVLSLGWEDPVEEGMATHTTILACRIPWTEEPGRIKSIGSQRVEHD